MKLEDIDLSDDASPFLFDDLKHATNTIAEWIKAKPAREDFIPVLDQLTFWEVKRAEGRRQEIKNLFDRAAGYSPKPSRKKRSQAQQVMVTEEFYEDRPIQAGFDARITVPEEEPSGPKILTLGKPYAKH